MRISDWSSDVCSSDLFGAEAHRLGHAPPIGAELAEIGDHDQSVEHRDAEQGDKAHRGGNRQTFSRSPERDDPADHGEGDRSEEHTSELQSLMRISYAVFCLKKKKNTTMTHSKYQIHTQQ